MRTRNLTNLISDVRIRTQTENMSAAYPDAVITEWLNQAWAELYEKLITAKGADFYERTQTITSTSNVALYPLPEDFYQLLAVEAYINGQPYWLRSFTRAERAILANTNIFTDRDPLAYKIRENQIEFRPIPPSATQIVLYYVSAPDRMLAAGDSIDGVAGWEQYIIDWSAKQIAEREHDEALVKMLSDSIALLSMRIDSMAAHRDAGYPPRVTDVTLSRSPRFRRRRW